MVRLEPMSEADFAQYLARAIPRRAERFASRGIWSEREALDASRETYGRLLPQGVHTPGNHFCHVIDGVSGQRVGEAWYTTRKEGGVLHFWVEWIWIEPEHRRHGYATEALRLLEGEARRLGAPQIGLDVWTDNPGAVELYRKLGYSPALLSMVKAPDPSS